MRSGLLAFVAIVGCAPQPSGGGPAVATPRAFSAIRYASAEDAVRGYFAGSDQCASRLLRAAFHPAAHMAWIDGDADGDLDGVIQPLMANELEEKLASLGDKA